MLQLLRFSLILFIVSFISDIILNDLSKTEYSPIISSLKPYFNNKGIVESGIYAGLTILVAFIPTVIMFHWLVNKNKWIPSHINELVKFTLIAYSIGFIVDILIDKFKIFGTSLDNYYYLAGAGMWGAISFVFAIIITYLILNGMFTC
jgi:hypothetical protein